MVDVRADRERVEQLWRSGQGERYAPLEVAAAFAFHRSRRSAVLLLSEDDYSSALNISAAALSCLAPIYTLNARQERISVRVDLSTQKFRDGACVIRCLGGAIVASLAIARGDVHPAAVLMARAGIEYTPLPV